MVFVPALVIALVWLCHSAHAFLIGTPICIDSSMAGAPLSPYNVTNLVTIGNRIQTSLIPIPTLDVGSSQLSPNAMARATFQASFWDQATGFHDLASSPLFEFAPNSVAQQMYEAPVPGIPVWQPQLPPLFI